MKRIALLFAAFAALISFASASNPTIPEFDPALAQELGADEYGMRAYVFVMLKTGPTAVTDPERRRELFAGHFANINRLAERGELVLAGPFSDADDRRGIFILNAPSIEAAKEMVEGDPAVAAGIFTAEYSKFYGSAALMQVNAVHKKLQSKEIE